MIELPMILTDRLKLISLTPECLHEMLNGDFVKAGASSGFDVSRNCSLLRHPSIPRRLGLIEKDAEQLPWMYRAIVRKNDDAMVGHISFHHKAPDPDLLEYSNNAAELGYAIDADQRRKGYAKESVLAMIDWANMHAVTTFILSISPKNYPSLMLAESMNFQKISERIDDTDGLEYVFILEMQKSVRNRQEIGYNGT
jgi:RimJ/RimL family protein N-acetyltransferase